MGLIFFCYWLL